MIFLPNLFHSFFYEKIFLKSTQVALIQKEDNFIIRQKNYYRNVFTDHAPVILDLEDKDIGLELPIDNEIHYFKLFLTVDVNKKDSLLKAADRYLITRKGVDVEFLKPKLKNIINDFLKENENLSKKTFLHFINNSMKTSEELNCIDFSDIDIYKKIGHFQ